MSSVLDHATRMTDLEIRNDLDCLLAAAPEHEHRAIKAYRRARINAWGWMPDKAGANNHREIVADAPVTGRACVVCSGPLPPKARADRQVCSPACRKAKSRGGAARISGTSAGKDAGQKGYESGENDPPWQSPSDARSGQLSVTCGRKLTSVTNACTGYLTGDCPAHGRVPYAPDPTCPVDTAIDELRPQPHLPTFDSCTHRADHASCLECLSESTWDRNRRRSPSRYVHAVAEVRTAPRASSFSFTTQPTST